jgi:hypothetical protein
MHKIHPGLGGLESLSKQETRRYNLLVHTTVSSGQSRKKDSTRHVFEINVRVTFPSRIRRSAGEPAVAEVNRTRRPTTNQDLNHSRAARLCCRPQIEPIFWIREDQPKPAGFFFESN